MNKRYLFKYVSLLIFIFAIFTFGCSTPPTIIKEVRKYYTLDQYNQLTVIGLPIRLERQVIKNYKQHFPNVNFIKRKRLTEAVQQEDLVVWHVDDKTRATLKKVFNLDAIIFGECIDCGTLNVLPSLRIGIVDIKTGEMIAHVTTVRIRLDQISEAIHDAIDALK
jgi:hypothetical protein